MSDKEKFLLELDHDIFCGYDWCRHLYAYQYADPAFLERVYARLDELGRCRTKSICALYLRSETEYWSRQEQEAGKWLVKRIDREYERQVRDYADRRAAQFSAGLPQDW